jgi:hypothetical protein
MSEDILDKFRKVVYDEIEMRATVATRQAYFLAENPPKCLCPTCSIQIPNQVCEDAVDWVEMMRGVPTKKDLANGELIIS